jgi:hypothetical protein
METNALIAQKQRKREIGDLLGHRGCRFMRGAVDRPDDNNRRAAVSQEMAGIAHDLANVLLVVMADAEAIPRSLDNPIRVAQSAHRIWRQAVLGVDIQRRILTVGSEPDDFPAPAIDMRAESLMRLEAGRLAAHLVAGVGTMQPRGLKPSEMRDMRRTDGIPAATQEEQESFLSVHLPGMEEG